MHCRDVSTAPTVCVLGGALFRGEVDSWPFQVQLPGHSSAIITWVHLLLAIPSPSIISSLIHFPIPYLFSSAGLLSAFLCFLGPHTGFYYKASTAQSWHNSGFNWRSFPTKEFWFMFVYDTVLLRDTQRSHESHDASRLCGALFWYNLLRQKGITKSKVTSRNGVHPWRTVTLSLKQKKEDWDAF